MPGLAPQAHRSRVGGGGSAGRVQRTSLYSTPICWKLRTTALAVPLVSALLR